MKLQTLFIVGLALTLAGCAKKAEVGSDAFVRHMHHHASQLERLNAALAEGDLDAVQTPAYWLRAHEELRGVPDHLRPYVKDMRAAAAAVADAPDIPSARAAAERLKKTCGACHAAAGVDESRVQLD